jgi:DNA-binding SARP family transcriptional activator
LGVRPGIDVNALRPPQARLLLAFLVTERHRPVPREQVAHVLWEGTAPPNWEAALRVLVGRTRKFLTSCGLDGDALTTAGRCHRLGLPDSTIVDVEQAREGLRQAQTALNAGSSTEGARRALRSAEHARAIFELPWLPGLSGRWWQERDDEHREHLAEVLGVICEAHARLGDHSTAVTAARQAWSLLPLQERALRRLMTAHQRAGNRAAAIETYHAGRRRLHDRLGIDPDPATQELFLALLDDGPRRRTN